jgi:catechol 2,3-dioxygenase-like lactoylglutathione lyase family enzyme
MEQRMSLITLGVVDLQRATTFYENVVGWKAEASPPGVTFFNLSGFIFALWPHADLAKDMGKADASVSSYRGCALAYNARSRAEVDEIFARLQQHDATILKAPQNTFWGGYSGYFADPDGHAWEIAHNPSWTIGADGRISMRA